MSSSVAAAELGLGKWRNACDHWSWRCFDAAQYWCRLAVENGASASVKGFAGSAPFAMGKFAVRGLAQSLARELAPRNIHVAHFVIDGAVRSAERAEPTPDSFLDPDAIAATYWNVVNQPRSAWTWEVELRPWVEKF